MYSISAETYGEGWLACTKLVLDEGASILDEEVKLIECLNICLRIDQPQEDDSIIRILADSALVERGIKKFESIKLLPNAYFSYAQRLYSHADVNQIEWLVNRLRNKPETKSATISTLVAGDENAHLPCLSLVDFKIRDGRLNMTTVFRSQDILTRHPGNSMALSRLHTNVGDRLNVVKGTHFYHIISAHIYERDLPSIGTELREEIDKTEIHFVR